MASKTLMELKIRLYYKWIDELMNKIADLEDELEKKS